MASHLNLAKFITHTTQMYRQHVEYVEKFTGERFLNFAVKQGGSRRFADILQGAKGSA
jgi:hypothetical protein